MTFGEKLQGENRTIEALVRRNSLFLSAAAQNNHAALMPIYRWFSRSLRFVFGERRWTPRTVEQCANAKNRAAMIRMLGSADLGIVDLQVTEAALPEEARRFSTALASLLKSELKVAGLPPEFLENHKTIQMLHQLGDSVVPLREDQESAGTIAYLTLLGPTLAAIETGGVLCVDELDSSLHPLLAKRLIQLFNDREVNTQFAQLIFNTHDTNLLGGGILRRDQIWFVEKKRDGTSELYPLSDFKPRKEENLANGYLQGRYGAIPFINNESLPFDKEPRNEEK